VSELNCDGPLSSFAFKFNLRRCSTTAEIEADPVAKQKLGWVREMYAYDLAAAVVGVQHRVAGVITRPLLGST
jgi:hypothetical protein